MAGGERTIAIGGQEQENGGVSRWTPHPDGADAVSADNNMEDLAGNGFDREAFSNDLLFAFGFSVAKPGNGMI